VSQGLHARSVAVSWGNPKATLKATLCIETPDIFQDQSCWHKHSLNRESRFSIAIDVPLPEQKSVVEVVLALSAQCPTSLRYLQAFVSLPPAVQNRHPLDRC